MNNSDRDHDPFNGAPSFPLGHRLLRVAFKLTWTTFASWTPAPMHRWRIMLLNFFGAKVTSDCFVYGSVRVWYPPNLCMKGRATLGPGVDCYTMAPIIVEAYAVVSQGASLCTGTHDIHHASFQIYAKPIRICAHSWICAGAFVGPGVTVGEGAVLAAHAVTFKDLQSWTIYHGNPAAIKGARKGFIRQS